MSQRYRKKQVEVEAVQWTGENIEQVMALAPPEELPHAPDDPHVRPGYGHSADGMLSIPNPTGTMEARPGDYIVVDRSMGPHPVPLKPEIFQATYEPASAPEVQGVDAEDLERLERMADSIERGGPADGDLGVAGDEAATFLRRVARSLASYQPDSGVDQLQVVVDFLASWRYCPVSSAESPSQACLEDAAKQLLDALTPTQPDSEQRYTLEEIRELLTSKEVIDKAAEERAIEELYDHWNDGRDFPGREENQRRRYAQLAKKPGVQESWKRGAEREANRLLDAAVEAADQREEGGG